MPTSNYAQPGKQADSQENSLASTAPSKKRAISRSALWALALFVVLWLFDYPKPSYDDLFYIGASLNIAAGGDFSNPLLARQGFPSHYFFVYPPLHAQTLGLWLKCLGVSALALTAFQMMMNFITSVSTIAVLRRRGAPEWLEWLVPLGVAAALLPSGLRPEPYSVALIMAGFAVIECGSRNWLGLFAGFSLIVLGAWAAPRFGPLAAGLLGLSIWKLWNQDQPGKARGFSYLAGPFFAAGLVNLVIFLTMIDFRVHEFWSTFHLHASRVMTSKCHEVLLFFKYQRITAWPVWGVFMLLLALVLRQPRNAQARLGFCVLGALFCEGVIANITIQIFWYVILAMFAFAVALLAAPPRALRTVMPVLLGVPLLLTNAKPALHMLGQVTGKIEMDAGPDRDQALHLKCDATHKLLVESASARYLYGYQLPAGTIDLGFSAPFPGTCVTTSDLKPGDVYIVTHWGLGGLERDTYLPHVPRELWNPLRLRSLELDRHPRRIYIIPSEACKGLRADVERTSRLRN